MGSCNGYLLLYDCFMYISVVNNLYIYYKRLHYHLLDYKLSLPFVAPALSHLLICLYVKMAAYLLSNRGLVHLSCHPIKFTSRRGDAKAL